MASIIVGLGATVANWKPMATTSFSGFIGALLGSTVGELLTRWSVPPLLPTLFSENYALRMWMATTIFFLIGIVGGIFEKASVVQSPVRVVVAGWLSIAISFGCNRIYDRLVIK
ncbi:hypothetical protein CDL15_Pgr027022 [Punica granatum]|uniref:Uncharacterized protein n=1 Tax=Punica granatum TaxID=22663 RepID=A0A218WGL5_PUNGR|nr:hypothetical protein CDL15_Pgr027022 [Punica granatum]